MEFHIRILEGMRGGTASTYRWETLASPLAAIAAILSSGLVLVGWQFDIVWLRAPLPGVSIMVPTTATCFILCGISLLFQLWEPVPKWRSVAGKLLTVPVLFYSLAVLAEYLFSADLKIDSKLFPSALSRWPLPVFPGRFAPNTAVAFPLLALGLLFLGRRLGKIVVSEVLAVLAGLIAFVSIIGYTYRVEALYSAGTQVQMSLHTSLMFAVLSAAILLARPNRGVAQLLTDPGPSGILSRRLLAYTFLVLTVLGWISLQAQRTGWIDLEFGTALLVVCTIVAFGIAVFRTARLVHEYERGQARATEALIRTEKLASVGRMAATVAHEINNPLAAVTNAVYLLSLEPTLSAAARQNVMLADEQLRRVAHLTRQTLGFYRERNAPGAVDVCAIADEVLLIYRQRIAHKGVEVQRRYHRDGIVWGVAGELRQVISNLIANSIDALPPSGGKLAIRVSRCLTGIDEISTIRITVADNGAGIPPELRSRVFEPFFTTKENVGTGLGLWVSRDIIAGQSGHIRFKSAAGKGTVFCIFLLAHCVDEPKSVLTTATA